MGILSSNWMVNRVNAAFQSRSGIVHFLLMLAKASVTFHHIESISFSAFRSHPVFGIKEPVRFQHLQAS